jgi:tetratricopeptide (TPR) repeat protein
MSEIHLSAEEIETFMAGQLPASESRRVLRHLFTGCATCQATASRIWSRAGASEGNEVLARSSAVDSAYDEVLDRVFRRAEHAERALVRERSEARELHTFLSKHSIARQRLFLRNGSKYRSRALCELLIDESHLVGFQDRSRSLEIAETAVMLAGLLSEDELGVCPLAALRARASAQLGNALRINDDLNSAERAFVVAEEFLAQAGGGTYADEARISDLKASLRKDQRRWMEAIHLHDRVIEIYERLGQRHQLGRSLSQKAIVYYELADHREAVRLLRRSLELLEPKEEPRMFLSARHNLIMVLSEMGQYREAFALLFHTRPLYLKKGDRMNLIRLRWLEGTVAAGLGRLDQAELAFREVSEAFTSLRLSLDAAMVNFDLAAVYARQGRTQDVRRLAEGALAVFQANGIHREAIAAIAVLHQAAIREQAEAGLIGQIAGFVKRARMNPDLQFSETALAASSNHPSVSQ